MAKANIADVELVLTEIEKLQNEVISDPEIEQDKESQSRELYKIVTELRIEMEEKWIGKMKKMLMNKNTDALVDNIETQLVDVLTEGIDNPNLTLSQKEELKQDAEEIIKDFRKKTKRLRKDIER